MRHCNRTDSNSVVTSCCFCCCVCCCLDVKEEDDDDCLGVDGFEVEENKDVREVEKQDEEGEERWLLWNKRTTTIGGDRCRRNTHPLILRTTSLC